jgi:predicted membrane protein
MNKEANTMIRTCIRAFVASLFLVSWPVHIYLVFFNTEIYRRVGETALIPVFSNFWANSIMHHVTIFALSIMCLQVLIGCLLISRGKWVKIGLVSSILFCLIALLMGSGYQTPNLAARLLVNYLPFFLITVLQLPFLWGWDERTIFEMIQYRFFDRRLSYLKENHPDMKLFDADEEETKDVMVGLMKKIGSAPWNIYAFKKTGILMVEANRKSYPEDDIREWDEAIEEYHRRVAEGDIPDI